MELLIVVKVSMFIICWNILMSLINKNKSGYLFCGMVGFCGDHPGDPNLLKLMMIYNQERGEDSTGFAINNQITKDTEKVIKFLTKNAIIISENDENYSFIAHARKRSSGSSTSKELAHPFGMYKDGIEKEKYDLILAMNGTLTNTEAMAKHFEVDYKSHLNSDTQILTRIMTKLGEKEYTKALESYDGTATLLFFTPKYPNTLMVYKDPERPLFYWQKAKNEMYISSMEEPLQVIGADPLDIHSFADNILYRINKGKITKSIEIKRTPIKNKVISYPRSNYNMNDYDYNNENFGHMGGGCTPFRKDNNTRSTDSIIIDMFKPTINNTPKDGKHIYCQVDKYMRNGHPLMDEIWLSNDGEVKIDDKNPDKFSKYYFIAGFLIKDEKSYNELKEKASDNKGFSLPKFKDIKLSELCKYFSQPCLTVCDNKQLFLLNEEWGRKVSVYGDVTSYVMPFTDIKYTLKYTGRVIEVDGVDIKVCEISNVEKDTSFISIIGPISPNPKNMDATIINIILNNQEYNCFEVYNAARISILRDNNTIKTKAFFFRKLFKIFREEHILDEYDSTRFFELGEACGFNMEKGDFVGEVQVLLRLFRNHRQREIDLKETFAVSNEHGKDDLNDNPSDVIDEQIDTQNQAIIDSLLKSNPYYTEKQFTKDFYDATYNTLSEYSRSWVSDYNTASTEHRQFCEAILLCLHMIGRIDVQGVLNMLNMSEKNLNLETERLYLSYKDEILKPEVIHFEDLNEDEYEADAINAYQDFMSGVEININEINRIPEEKRTPLIKKLLNHYYLAKGNVVRDEKIKQND